MLSMLPQGVKACKVCGREFPISGFRVTAVGLMWPDGRSNWCEDCIGESDQINREGKFPGLTETKRMIRERVLARG
jgi:hypothetical protein